jgi:diguanylate cyclase (GGDEF)-like protein/PAS domain S-box-containing protein
MPLPNDRNATDAAVDERSLQMLLDTVPDLIFYKDLDSRFTWVNLAYARYVGLTHPHDVIGKTDADFFSPSDARIFRAEERHLLSTGEALIGKPESRRGADGRTQWVLTNKVPIRDSGGRITGIVGIAREITDRKADEDAVRQKEARFSSLIRNALDIITILQADGTISYESPAIQRIFGYQPDDLIGLNAFTFVHPDDLGPTHAAFLDALRDPSFTPQVEFRFRHQDGSWRWLEATGTNLLADPAVNGVVVNSRDVTERKQADADRAQRARHSSLRGDVNSALAQRDTVSNILQRCADAMIRNLDAALVRIWLLDEQSQVLQLNASAGLYTHLDGEHGRIPVGKLKIGRIAQTGQPHLTNTLKSDVLVDQAWVQREGMIAFAGYPLAVDGQVVGVLGLFARHPLPDDTLDALGTAADSIAHGVQRKAFETRLWYQAHHDSLTGLPNRPGFLHHLDQALQHAAGLHRPVTVLFLDLDRFKVVNDSLGHIQGDRVLTAVAARLAALLGEGGLVARFGGDEFAMLIEGHNVAWDIESVAKLMLEQFHTPFIVNGREVFTSASIGIATSNVALEESTDILQAADIAMYHAKAKGLGEYAIYTPTMNRLTVERLQLETDLQRALERNQLVLHYQPKIDLSTGGIVAVEALLRWHHPTRGMLLPADFLPIAEATGLIIPIGRWVLTEACRQASAWRTQIPHLANHLISVNLSAREFRQSNLVAQIARVLEEIGLPAAALELEITEQVMFDDPQARTTLLALEEMGVHLALDDFGTGHSALDSLRKLPIEMLKIDPTFIRELAKNGRTRAVVQGIVSLAHNLGMQVVAEGIETEAQLEDARAIGIDIVQGHYVATPLPQADCLAFLAAGLSSSTES